MELKEFISTALQEIVAGVSEANEATKGNGAIVAPPLISESTPPPYTGQMIGYSTNKKPVFAVEFDIVLSLTEGEKGEAKLGVFSALIGAGIGKESEQSNTQHSRLRFTVPLALFPGDQKK